MREKLCVAPVEDKITIHLRWFAYIHRKAIDTSIRRVDCIHVTSMYKARGRPKKTWIEQFQMTLSVYLTNIALGHREQKCKNVANLVDRD